MKNKIVKDTLALTVITLVSGLLLGLVNDITAGPIASQQAKEKEEAYKAVFADAASFETVTSGEDTDLESYLDENGYKAQNIDEVMLAKDDQENELGYAFTVTTAEGYGGIYIPLIVVNCIILGRAEAYASKNKPIPSLFDGIGMGLGFTLSITCIGAVRELIGAGSIFGKQILPLADAAAGKIGYEPVTIFILAPGAFFVLAFLSALQNKFKIGAAKRGIDPSNPDCKGGCASCGNSMCSGKRG